MSQDKFVKVDDEQLSAFLDGELSEADMERIREQLMEDENLADRLADLAMVDEVVALSYAAIDTRPMPDAISKLILHDDLKAAKVIAFPRLKKTQENIQKYVAIAASVALFLGFGLAQIVNNNSNNWQSVAQILENTESGAEKLSANGVQIKPRLTFINKDGNYCRQFSMIDKDDASENIACRKNNYWKLSDSIKVKNIRQPGTYQTASGGSVLDEKIEKMASGDFFDARAEAAVIHQQWIKPN